MVSLRQAGSAGASPRAHQRQLVSVSIVIAQLGQQGISHSRQTVSRRAGG